MGKIQWRAWLPELKPGKGAQTQTHKELKHSRTKQTEGILSSVLKQENDLVKMKRKISLPTESRSFETH